MYDMDWLKLMTDNSVLLLNLGSTELGLLIGMWLRGRFIDKTRLSGQNVIDFLMFSLVLAYTAMVSTFSSWPVPIWGYFAGGVILPPFTVPIYNGLVAATPNLLKSFLPEGIIKWVLEHTQPPAIPSVTPTKTVLNDTNTSKGTGD